MKKKPSAPATGLTARGAAAGKTDLPIKAPKKPTSGARAGARSVANDALPVVVGIGASAGGLEAFSRLLTALPADTGMAFVLVQHLDPNHESVLSELLARTTSLQVSEIKDRQNLEPNRVYVIPPNTNLAVQRGILRLSPRTAGRGFHRPIHDFLRSLAEDRGHRAIGVILSGTASDGTLGLEAIKAEGGITFAQDEATARFDSMPHSAVAAGVVDFVLPPEGIAAELARMANEPYLTNPPEIERSQLPTTRNASAKPITGPSPKAAGNTDEDGFRRILQLLHDVRGVDFSLYRSTTIRRRIDRRMLLDNVPSPLRYSERLRAHPKELEALYQDLLIGVTSFFRDPQTFEFLQREVFPQLVKNRTADEAVRVWVSGCSTGQEAYSLAMAYLEFAAQAGVNVPLRVFATDLNEAMLERARAGLYAESLMHNVSKERLKRFFTEESGSYRISKSVRELVVFAHHNVFADPPFSHMDVISCLNLLIYLEPALQSRVIPTFHYALKPGGVLVLGASETVGRHTDLFATLDSRCRVYTKFRVTTKIPRPAPAIPFVAPTAARYGYERTVLTADAPDVDALREADRAVLARYAPAGVVVDATLEIVQFRGMTGRYLEPQSGKASFNLLKMAREGLMLPLRALIERARHENRAVREEGVRFQRDGHAETVNLEVVPLRAPPSLLVLFEAPAPHAANPALEPPEPKRKSKKTADRAQPAADSEAADGVRQVEGLQRELLETRDYLRFIQEQGEAANEELQSTNEEAQSANEEMQSLNEELETAKEELESSNEEMRTINEELNERNAELRHLNDDHLNFQASSELAIVAISTDLSVRRFTPQAELVLGLRAGDIGRPIGHVRHGLDSPDLPSLEALIAEVIQSESPTDREVRDCDGRWFLMRVRPYRTLQNHIDGALLVLFGIDALKRAELERERLQHETEVAFESLGDGLIALNRDWTVTYINTAGARLAGLAREAMLGGNFWALFPELSESIFGPTYRKAMTERVAVELEANYAPLETQFEIRAVPVEAGILVLFRDVTDRRRAELIVEETQVQLRALSESQRRFLADAAHELRAPLAVIQGNLEVIERYPNMLPDERAEAVTESARAATRLGRLANDLLSLARGDAGDGLRLEDLELAPILEETLHELSRLTEGLRLESGALEPCTVLGDRDKLKQLALILLDNAIKYTPAGGRVSLELHRQETQAEFRISNTGPAISPEDLERVFERFYRTDASRSRQTGGTGLGLPIARWIAGQHGGTVKLESEPGVGTTAIVRLPLVHDTDGAASIQPVLS